jgi:HTH-type transcriptional regulator/antitoxin HigA
MPTTTTKPKKSKAVADDYLSLVMAFPLKPIRDDEQLTEANAVAGRLAVRGEDALSDGEADYLDVLSDLIERYERGRYPGLDSKATPAEHLADLAERHGLTASDIGNLLGNRSLGSKLMRGEREPSKAHALKLAERFNVSPALFLA